MDESLRGKVFLIFLEEVKKTLPFYFKEKEEKKDKEQNICVQKVFFIENIFMGALHDPLCLGQDTGILHEKENKETLLLIKSN